MVLQPGCVYLVLECRKLKILNGGCNLFMLQNICHTILSIIRSSDYSNWTCFNVLYASIQDVSENMVHFGTSIESPKFWIGVFKCAKI